MGLRPHHRICARSSTGCGSVRPPPRWHRCRGSLGAPWSLRQLCGRIRCGILRTAGRPSSTPCSRLRVCEKFSSTTEALGVQAAKGWPAHLCAHRLAHSAKQVASAPGHSVSQFALQAAQWAKTSLHSVSPLCHCWKKQRVARLTGSTIAVHCACNAKCSGLIRFCCGKNNSQCEA